MLLPADAISPPVRGQDLVTAWQTGWISVLALSIEAGVGGWYLWARRRLARRGRPWSTWRTASFLGGTALLLVAVQSGLASYDDSVFSVHVVQHLLLMNFAPLLFALAAPTTLALQSSSRRVQRALLRVLHHPVVEVITHPAVVVSLAYLTMLLYFLTPFYRFSLEHPLVHELSHVHFLVSGSLFWWMVVGPDPSRWRLRHGPKLAVLAVGIPVNAILGIALTGSRTSIAPAFHTLADTKAGGSILWVVGELTTLVAMGIVVSQWMRYEEREANRADRRLDAAERAARRPGPAGALVAGEDGVDSARPAPPG